MAVKELLTCLEKRELLNESVVSVDKLLEWGQRFEEASLIYDAVNFFEKAGAREDLARMLDEAKSEGNLFLVNRLCKVLKTEPTKQDWLVVGEAAERVGKLTFATEAYRLAGKEIPASASLH